MNTAAAIELVLSHGKKSSTYKLAVLRALVDLTIERPAQEPRNGRHFVPLVEVARRVLAYYWRLAIEGIPQGTQPARVVGVIEKLSESGLSVPGIELRTPAAGLPLTVWIMEADTLPKALVGALGAVRQLLIDQPLRYLPNLGGRRAHIFSLHTRMPPGEPPLLIDASYEEHRRAAPRWRRLAADGWVEILSREATYLVLSARAYEEISAMRFWLLDALLVRWARECERFAESRRRRGENPPAVRLSHFELEAPERDRGVVVAVKSMYERLGFDRCLYTGQPLGPSWDLDHLLPFSRFPVDLFWNLVPSAPTVNKGPGGKHAKLPRLTDDVRARYTGLLERCVGAGGPAVVQDCGSTYRRYFQREPPSGLNAARVVPEITSVVESSWARLEAAGVEVWEPVRA